MLIVSPDIRIVQTRLLRHAPARFERGRLPLDLIIQSLL